MARANLSCSSLDIEAVTLQAKKYFFVNCALCVSPAVSMPILSRVVKSRQYRNLPRRVSPYQNLSA